MLGDHHDPPQPWTLYCRSLAIWFLFWSHKLCFTKLKSVEKLSKYQVMVKSELIFTFHFVYTYEFVKLYKLLLRELLKHQSHFAGASHFSTQDSKGTCITTLQLCIYSFIPQFGNSITKMNGTGHIQSTRAFYQRVPNKYKRFANPNIFSYWPRHLCRFCSLILKIFLTA